MPERTLVIHITLHRWSWWPHRTASKLANTWWWGPVWVQWVRGSVEVRYQWPEKDVSEFLRARR